MKAELGPVAKRLAAIPPVVVPVPTGLVGGGSGIGDNLLIIGGGDIVNGVHLLVSSLYTCDGEPSTIPCLDGVAITVPSAIVSILNDPLAGGRGIILTRLGELIMVREYCQKRFVELRLLISLILLKTQIINLLKPYVKQSILFKSKLCDYNSVIFKYTGIDTNPTQFLRKRMSRPNQLNDL